MEQVLGINEIKNTVAELGRQYGAERIYLFGSYARGEADHDSDIDLRIDKGKIRGLFALSGLRLALEDRLGIKVDLPQILPCMQFQFCFILPLCGRPQEQDCLLKIAVIGVDYLDYLLTDPFQHRLLPFPDLSNLFFTALMELFPCQASFYTKTKTACIRLNTPKVLTYR